ncbi:MAG: type I DNA topoisomerase [bacterium]|nr:type I DNA topoisomerase [bacterium]
MSKTLVIVESPTKAKTLKKFLGGGDNSYVVESSVGHVRDLPMNASEIPASLKKEPWARLGVNVEDGFKPLYVVQSAKKKKITELKRLLKGVDRLLLATDEDREGEAISWHLVELLNPKVPVFRMVFHEITKGAILEALEQTRDIDENMVSAQETRRIIDRLYGYEVSPILWRKVAPRLSAGRVQSVAIRLLVEREKARMRFTEAFFWDLIADFKTQDDKTFRARLVSLDKKRIAVGKDFDPDTGKLTKDVCLLDAAQAEKLRGTLADQPFVILSAEEKPFSRSPAPPFTTSTLQQEGNRKLRFDAKRTMRAAQRLYENGYITYMRTDSVALSNTAIQLTRDTIGETYGTEFLPDEPRRYKNKVKNAQEAHEAIRPAGDHIATLEEIRKKLTEGGKPANDEAKIYELIYKRTLACQMKDARGRRMTLKVRNKNGDAEAVFQANGNVIDFPGFLRAYVEGADDPDAALSEREVILPPVKENDEVQAAGIESQEHKTSPPARLTEATLVKTLEELGIGRPSTYASIIDTIQRREYTFKKGTALVPTFTAMAVVALMQEHLTHLIDPSFTALMEDRLDAISRGEQKSLPYLEEFYHGEGEADTSALRPLIDKKTADIDPRTVCSIPIGKDDEDRDVIVRVGRYGPFVQRGEDTATLPDQMCPDELTIEAAERLLDDSQRSQEPIGTHTESGLPMYVKVGRYGPYVQLGDADGDEKPKMVSLLKNMQPTDVTQDVAEQLLSLPRTIGKDDDGEDIVAYNGRYGPYIKRGSDTRSLEPSDDLLTIGRERALALLAQEKRGRGARQPAEPIKIFEKVEALGDVDVKLLKGRYGPYVSDGRVNASLPRDFGDPETLTLEAAVELLEEMHAKKGTKGTKKAKKKAAKKPAAKKKAAKKPAAKKAAKKATKKKKSSK